ncbi:MAG: HalD/BesD family halogenase [Pikeienuella sp.]
MINLDLYPLDTPGTALNALIERCQADIREEGMFTLPDFMTQAAVAETMKLSRSRFETESFLHQRSHNIYFKDHVDGLADDHPALVKRDTCNRTLCADQVADTPLTNLYEWEPFAAFLAATMGKSALYPMDDPLARVNAMTYRAGEALNWHFDRSEFTTTLLLEAPEEGGEFEYRPSLRTDDDPNYDGVAQLLEGRDDNVKKISLTPGALNVFKGKNTAHRVTPPKGDSPRTIAVFSYYEEPGVIFSPSERLGFYGREG